METVDTISNVVREVVNPDGERYIMMGFNKQIEVLPTKKDIQRLLDTLRDLSQNSIDTTN